MHLRLRRPLRMIACCLLAFVVALTSVGVANVAHGQEPIGIAISGLAFVDANNSGARDADEISIAGLALTLFTPTRSFSTVTDDAGLYRFEGVMPGRARLSAELQVGYRPGLVGVAGDPRFDIDADASGTELIAGLVDLPNIDLAFLSLPVGLASAPPFDDPLPPAAPVAVDGAAGAVSGIAFIDHNNNSVRDSDEIGVNGLPVSLHAGIDGYDDSTIVQTVMTRTDGTYELVGVVPGRYILSYRASSWGPSFSNRGGDDTIDSDFDTSTTHSFVVNTEQTVTNLDAGFQDQPFLFGDAPAKVSGLAFLDANSNGRRDQGENALSGVPITFSLSESTFEVTVTTSSNGTYVVDLIPGSYVMGGAALEQGELSVPLVGTDRRFDSNLTPNEVLIAAAQVLTHFDGGFLQQPAGSSVVAPPATPAAPPAPVPVPGGLGSVRGQAVVASFGGRSGLEFTLVRYEDPNSPGTAVGSTFSDAVGSWAFFGVPSGYYRVVLKPVGTRPEVSPRESLSYKTDFYPSQTAIFALNGDSDVELLALRDERSIPPDAVGDANCDGTVTAVDARLVLRYLSGEFLIDACTPDFPALDMARADANRDGEITVLDALLIARRISTACPPGTFLWEDGLCYPVPGATPGPTVTPTSTTPEPREDYGSVPCRPGYVPLSNGRCWPRADNTNPTTVTPVPTATPG